MFLCAGRTERDSAKEAAQQASIREVPKGLGQLWEQLLAAEAEANQTRNGTASGVRGTIQPQGAPSAALGDLLLVCLENSRSLKIGVPVLRQLNRWFGVHCSCSATVVAESNSGITLSAL